MLIHAAPHQSTINLSDEAETSDLIGNANTAADSNGDME